MPRAIVDYVTAYGEVFGMDFGEAARFMLQQEVGRAIQDGIIESKPIYRGSDITEQEDCVK